MNTPYGSMGKEGTDRKTPSDSWIYWLIAMVWVVYSLLGVYFYNG